MSAATTKSLAATITTAQDAALRKAIKSIKKMPAKTLKDLDAKVRLIRVADDLIGVTSDATRAAWRKFSEMVEADQWKLEVAKRKTDTKKKARHERQHEQS